MEPTINVDPRIYGGEAPLTNDVPQIDPLTVGGGAAVAQPYVAPARVSQSDMGAGTSSIQQGQQAIKEANREVSGYGQSALAAVKSWSTTRIYDWYNAPAFAPEENFDVKPYVRNTPLQLSEVEQRFLATARSSEEFSYKLDNLKDQRKLYEQMGDHPILSGIIGMADPVYLAIDLASMGTATAATRGLGLTRAAGRALAGGEAAAASLAVGAAEKQVAAVGDGEVLFNALINGAASATFFNPRSARFERVDPAYPADELAAAAQRGERATASVEQRVVAEAQDAAEHARTARQQADTGLVAQPNTSRTYADIEQSLEEGLAGVKANAQRADALGAKLDGIADAPGPQTTIKGSVSDAALATRARNLDEATDAYTVLGRFEADPDMGPMIAVLRKEHGESLAQVRVREGDVPRPLYARDDATVYLDKKGNAFQALHEVVHGLTVQKLQYGKANPGSAHGKLVTELEDLRKQVAEAIEKMPAVGKSDMVRGDDITASYFTKNLEEFVAGLFAGNKDGFTRVMANLPTNGARNALTKMVGVVRKLLGIPPKQENALTKALGITDELMRTKLTTVNGTTGEATFFAPSGPPAQQAQQVGKWWDKTTAAGAGRKIEWSLNRELRGKGTEGNRVADLLVDDPINMTGDSAVSQRQAIRNDLSRHQAEFEKEFRALMAEQGAGVRQSIFNSGKAIKVQQRIEADLYGELMRRENAVRRGQQVVDPNVDPKLSRLADLHDQATGAGLSEMRSAGVRGADAIEGGAGYTPRKWDITRLESMEAAFEAAGSTNRQARKAVRAVIAQGIVRANGSMPLDVAEDIALAITERTRRKGYFEDINVQGAMGDDGAQGIRSLLAGSGISPDRLKRVEEFLTGRKDDEGMMAALKHRVPMDMHTPVTVNGQRMSLIDLVDTGVVRNLDGYLDDAAGQAGLARKGLVDNSDIVKLRGEFLKGIESEAERKVAASLFDNTIKAIKGQPVGEELSRKMRQLSAVTTSIGLANSGWWQLMEYANIATKYGMAKTARNVFERMPGVKQLIGQVSGSVDEAGSMAYVLSNNSAQDLRLRPFVTKLEDNFTVPVDDRLTLALQQAKQLVPYINAMKYVHHSQANITANLITDLVRKGAKGDVKAREALAKYGLEGHQLDAIKVDIDTHGMTLDNWSDGAWASVRGPLNKMMDDAVLRNRTGELPSFAQFSTLGKFVFTFRSFVLGAHNKVLAGTLGRHGFAGLGLLMAYQFPLAMATTFAVGAARGKPETDMSKLSVQAVSQMSAMGLLSELWGIASGQKQQFGASGLMAIDRIYKTTGQAAQGNFGDAGASLLSSVPLLAILPGIKALAEQMK